MKDSQLGLQATITAYAETSEIAETVAYVYFGHMIDVIAFENDIAISLFTRNGQGNRNAKYLTRRRLEKADFIESFEIARRLEVEEPKLLRAIGWYSKGKNTENTFDKFFSYWNVIEILGKAYHTQTARTQKGVKNMIYQSFLDYFGSENEWNIPNVWIDIMYQKRNEVVHGGQDNTVEAINNFSGMVPKLEEISHRLAKNIFESKYNRRDFEYFDF
ncbi:hypothetical protein HZI73_16825 [Vallitalea pronyensis]|uniref:Apea-like HEPN domain-containing protein n=1 Tax=Vallitalea pronyensis TaxID=1348613 RepID=A0A8J8MLT1_9FIRM|nr:methylamine utilization protein MauJ [Vallitalea pronyensis]QUI23856.1 hypothetical protein HZI73_16825 [Vallitalea pronyensis]